MQQTRHYLSQCILFCAYIAAATTISVAAAYKPSGIQSGPDTYGSTFCSSAVYNPINHTIIITGTTWGNFWNTPSTKSGDIDGDGTDDDTTAACFIATGTLPNNDDPTATTRWEYSQLLGVPNDDEECHAIMMDSYNNHLYLAGQSTHGIMLENLISTGTTIVSSDYGILLDMARPIMPANSTGTNFDSRIWKLLGGRILQASAVVYPVALTSNSDYVYVVTMESDDRTARIDEQKQQEAMARRSDIDPTRFFGLGRNYHMYVTRYRKSDLAAPSMSEAANIPTQPELTLHESWRKPYGTKDGASVDVTGLVLVGNYLIVVGSTLGYGEAFGYHEPEIYTSNDYDGFITRLQVETGSLVSNGANDLPSVRVESLNQRNDWITSVCASPINPNQFYVVGATEGYMSKSTSDSEAVSSVQAFLSLYEADSLQPVWTVQIGADKQAGDDAHVRGIACAVTPDGQDVYMAGIIENDAVIPLSGTPGSYGSTDIWVAQYTAKDGTQRFVRQIGTQQEDLLAMRGGLTTDKDGNAILVGNTYGSMYRNRQDSYKVSDVFYFTVGRNNGDIAIPLKHSEFTQDNGGVEDGLNASPEGSTNGVQTTAAAAAKNNFGSDGKWIGLLLLLLALVTGTVVGSIYAARRRSARDIATDRALVLEYLHPFDVEDIDLKHSATGGWHCSYSNDLAQGINHHNGLPGNGLALRGSGHGGRAMSTSFGKETVPLTGDNSILEDSLMSQPHHHDDMPSLGGSGSGGLDDSPVYSNSRNYGGLHNRSWDNQDSRKGHGWGRDII